MAKNFKLGAEVVDKLTGFVGILTGVASYLTGCDQYLVQPRIHDGDFKEGRWFDEGRLKVLKKKAVTKKSVKGRDNGCNYVASVK